MNKVPRWVFCYVGNKAYDFSSKKRIFCQKNDQIWPKIGSFGQFGPGHAGLFSALLVGRLVVVARGLYLARHLFTLFTWFSVMLVPKLLLTPIKIRIFGPKTAKFGPKYAFLVILGQILPFLHILSNARPKNNVNKVPRWVFRYVGNKAYDFSSKKKDFLPKNDQILPKTGIFGQFGPGHAGLFSALLVGRLVVVARGLYLARHLFTLCR